MNDVINGIILGCFLSFFILGVVFVWYLINPNKLQFESEKKSKIYVTNEVEQDNRIEWSDAEKYIVSGRKMIRPAKNDYLDHYYQDGPIGRFKFISVDYRNEENDLFYGVVSFVRYVTREETPKYYL